MSVEELPADLRALGDADQEVLLDQRPALRQLAPVPVLPTGARPNLAVDSPRSTGTGQLP